METETRDVELIYHYRASRKRRTFCGLRSADVPTQHVDALFDITFGAMFDRLHDSCKTCVPLGYDELEAVMRQGMPE